MINIFEIITIDDTTDDFASHVPLNARYTCLFDEIVAVALLYGGCLLSDSNFKSYYILK
jgi:hypothetical protein